MSDKAIIVKDNFDKSIIANVVLYGNLAQLKPEEKVRYYNMFCESLGLNPVTKPFQIITFQGKEILYATKDCTEQLRKINGVSVIDLQKEFQQGLYIVTAKVQDKIGRIDMATGVVTTMNLKGNDLANAIMKAETKAKRRATLSICGLGILDESELDTMPTFEKKEIDPTKKEFEKKTSPTDEKPNNKKVDFLKKVKAEFLKLTSDERANNYQIEIKHFEDLSNRPGFAEINWVDEEKLYETLKLNVQKTIAMRKKPEPEQTKDDVSDEAFEEMDKAFSGESELPKGVM